MEPGTTYARKAQRVSWASPDGAIHELTGKEPDTKLRCGSYELVMRGDLVMDIPT